MPDHDDLSLLIAAAKSAAAAALPFVGGDMNIQHKAADDSPVTAADHAANAAMEQVLRPARPSYGWLSEETPDTTNRLAADKVFIVDPIDGTRAFIEGGKSWAHALAVVHNGEVTAAVVYLPRHDKLYAAARGRGATLNGVPIRAAAQPQTPPQVLLTKPALKPELWPGGMPALERVYRPSLAYRLALVAEGRFDAMVTLRASWEWDIAAGALLVAEAGAVISDRTGAPLRFNAAHPQTNGAVTAPPAFHQRLINGLTNNLSAA